MLCSRCTGTIPGSAWTIGVIWDDGRAQAVNFCSECAAAILSHASLTRVSKYLDRTGWARTATGQNCR